MASALAVWPITSPLAKLVSMKSYPSSAAAITRSATSGRLSSGFRSKGMPFGDGTRRSSSPGNGWFSPPLKKKVTWAYFSLSAQWNWRRPASLMAWASGRCTFSGAKAMGRSLNFSWYMVMITNSRSFRPCRGNLSKPGSVKASVSSISRSPRRQQKTTLSPSAILPTGRPSASTRAIGDRE